MLLLYCMTEAGGASGELRGVHGAVVSTVEDKAVRCFVSAFDAEKKGKTQEDALAFWTVINELFQKASVIPFRYPTFMADEAAVRDFLQTNGSAYLADLQRIRGQVQAKITIRQPEVESQEKAPASGTEYLKQRQRVSQAVEAAMVAVTAAGDGIVKEWKESQKKDAKVLFALVERDALNEFKKRISQLKDSAAEIAFSGPWPPAEFVNCSPEITTKS